MRQQHTYNTSLKQVLDAVNRRLNLETGSTLGIIQTCQSWLTSRKNLVCRLLLSKHNSVPDSPSNGEQAPSDPSNKRQLRTVWFNPWRYQGANQVWAGLADAIIRDLTDAMETEERTMFLLDLNLARADAHALREGIFSQVNRERIRRVRVPAAIGLVFALVTGAVQASQVLNGLPGWAEASLFGGYVPTAVGIFQAVRRSLTVKKETLAQPASPSLERFADVPDFGSELGFAHHARNDIHRVLDAVFQQANEDQKLVIFIDDLDRCSADTVAIVAEALNQFIGGEGWPCFFVIGMDMQYVAAALEVHHEEIVSAMPKDSRVPLGWRFMEKFVQLPFLIPPPEQSDLIRYADLLTDTQNNNEPPAPVVETAKQIAAENPTLSQVRQAARRAADSLDTDDAVKEEFVNTIESIAIPIRRQEIQNQRIDEFRKTDNTYKDMVRQAVKEFSYNPREVKRFVNAFAVRYAMSLVRQSWELDTPTPEQLRRWVTLWMQWAGLALWIIGLNDHPANGASPSSGQGQSAPRNAKQALKILEQATVADGTPTHETWQKTVSAHLRIEVDEFPWLNDDQVWAFFLRESQLSEPLSTGSRKGFW